MTHAFIIAFLLSAFAQLDVNDDGCVSISEAPAFCSRFIGKYGKAEIGYPAFTDYVYGTDSDGRHQWLRFHVNYSRRSEKAITLEQLQELQAKENWK